MFQDPSVRGPKLPAYQESEDIAAYLTRFERIARLLKIEDDTLAVRLGSLLTGKTASLYSIATKMAHSSAVKIVVKGG